MKLTGTSDPTPRESYGPAAERYNRERELGREVAQIMEYGPAQSQDQAAKRWRSVERLVISLGLLNEEGGAK